MTLNTDTKVIKKLPMEFFWICCKCGCVGNWIMMKKHCELFENHMLETVAYSETLRSPRMSNEEYYGR